MKLVETQVIGSVDDYKIIHRETPEPNAGEVLIEVMVCGMGYVDALAAVGGYQVKPLPPFRPGQEIAGVVAKVGSGVHTLSVGDRVAARSFGGGLAEFVCAKEAAAIAIPGNMGFAEAAGFQVNYITVLHALDDRAAVRPGERLVVMGAAGGVGSAAVQLGKILGAHVVAVASSEAKREFALALGADTVLDTEPQGWRERLYEACGGKPDVVFDPVTGDLFEAAFRSLGWRGRHLVVGFLGGSIPKLPINLALMKGAALVGVDVRQFFEFEPGRAAEQCTRLLSWIAEGRLMPPVGKRFPLEQFAEAMTFALSGKGLGKTVIEVSNKAGS